MNCHTEEQANKKWCPYSIAAFGFLTASGNRDNSKQPGTQPIFNYTRCIASGCMAWQWVFDPSNEPETQDGTSAAVETKIKGYCGLARNK